MSKMKSRKLWAFIVWVGVMVLIIFRSPESITAALPWFGGVTITFIGGLSAIDFMEKVNEAKNKTEKEVL